MAENDEFFVPEHVDRQIESVRQFKKGDQLDAEAMAHLRSYYQTSAQIEQETLDRLWNRIADAPLFREDAQKNERKLTMQHDIHMQDHAGTMGSSRQTRPRRTSLMQRLGLLAAAVLLVALVGSITLVFYAAGHTPGGPGSPPPPVHPRPTTAPPRVPLEVTSINMSVAPASIAGLACGTTVTVTYTALFHVRPHSAGGSVQFAYTVNNGRSQTPVSLTFNPDETAKAYTFTWSGALPADHTYPGPGGVQVSSPNQLTSSLVGPTGQCTPAPTAAFQVTSIDMTVSPASIQGMACGTNVTVIYTATIQVAPNSPGGIVQFSYTLNNGRSQTPASVTFSPGQTVQTYSFTWRGPLPADHTYPGQGGIQVTSPNQMTSALVAPTGRCS